MKIEWYPISGLEKVFPDQKPPECSAEFTMLREDQLCFQMAVFLEVPPEAGGCRNVRVEAESPLRNWISLYAVELVPSGFPAGNTADGNYLRTFPGLFPDLLRPVEADNVRIMPGCWRSFWVQLRTGRDTPAGKFPVAVSITVEEGGETLRAVREVQVEVIGASLPEQKLLRTEWFHGDCLADYYHVPVFSEEHWMLLEKQIRMAADYGVNLILTPVFTPPLDTAVGGERTTIQLVDIVRENGQYRFGFDKLDQWVEICRRSGINRFEIAHLYTQWGAKHCPKIMATDNGEYRRIFGWESEAVSPEYRAFLEAFLPALTGRLRELGLEKDQVYFHISDEPGADSLEQYLACRKQAEDLIEGYPIMDALSDFAFYRQGVCPRPVVATDHVEPFLENRVENLWVYYCCGQGYRVSNRFMAMPSARTRAIGVQLYRYRIAGFLQWGFNFYNSQYSLRHIDPFAVTDADGAFPSGDAFLVYPGEDGEPWGSIRLHVFYDALCDLRALELLESLAGREFAESLIREYAGEVTFSEYPAGEGWLFSLRERVNREIARRV